MKCALLLALALAATAAARPPPPRVPPRLPERFVASFVQVPAGGDPVADGVLSEQAYDWPSRRASSSHRRCIVGHSPEMRAEPCRIVMARNNTYAVAPRVPGGCCVMDDTRGVPVWAPDRMQDFRLVDANATVAPAGGEARAALRYVEEATGFEWWLDAERPDVPLRWLFGGSRTLWDYTSALLFQDAPFPAAFDLPPGGACEQSCPFCWFKC